MRSAMYFPDFRDDHGGYDTDDDDRFHADYECHSPAFLTDRHREYTEIETGGKILLPQAALEQLIDQGTVMLFKLTNDNGRRTTHCGVLEFLPENETKCYVPYWMMRHLQLNEGDVVHVESVPYLPSATFARFQPLSEDFLEISNPKAVLEKVLRRFSCLSRGDVISIDYINRKYQLAVLELKPADAVCILECDMEVDFAPVEGAAQPRTLPVPVSEPPLSKSPSSSFTPFHGQGNRLNGKSKAADAQDAARVEAWQARGRPNYDYQYGVLEFFRPVTHSSSTDTNTNADSDKKTSATFQPFAGEGQALRQRRTAQQK